MSPSGHPGGHNGTCFVLRVPPSPSSQHLHGPPGEVLSWGSVCIRASVSPFPFPRVLHLPGVGEAELSELLCSPLAME